MKSRDRVRTYGEVFTPRHMVDQMLDLVSDDLEDWPDFVDKTFLEPAAGDGNFLVAILHRKLRAVQKRLSPEVWSDESLFALASIYGIELLEDNHEEARAAMLAEFVDFHTRHDASFSPDSDLIRTARFLVDTNIVRGNTLTGLDWRGEEIQFSWWNRVSHSTGMVQREPFSLASLRSDNGFDFTVYETYAACRIDRVHEEVRAGA
ncbi:DNA methyltransferase [Microbacterium sp. 2P01SA-2]|uniref:DNA methyltransferase n=1 Tax=Microbacterium sp. 2P01SA-2 TaxID=3132290 RepID=UPI0039A32AA8